MKTGRQLSTRKWLLGLCLAGALAGAQAASPETASAPLPTTLSRPLAQLLGSQRMAQWRITAIEELVVTQLVQQNLHQLDPDHHLTDQGTAALASRLRNDIRPVVQQTMAAVTTEPYTVQLQQALSNNLTATQASALRHWFATPQGQRYLRFSQQLDTMIASGLNQLSNQPITLRREQMPSTTVWQQRQRLLGMASANQVWQIARPGGKQPAVLGILRDMLCMQNGAALDQLGHDYQQDLPAFQAFERSAEGQALLRAQSQWALAEGERLQPLIQQAKQRLLTQQPAWQAFADSWRQAPAP